MKRLHLSPCHLVKPTIRATRAYCVVWCVLRSDFFTPFQDENDWLKSDSFPPSQDAIGNVGGKSNAANSGDEKVTSSTIWPSLMRRTFSDTSRNVVSPCARI